VMFGFDRLEEQMQRLEQFLVYSDDSQRQIASVNLLVARNTPVTFAQPASEIIEEIEPTLAPAVLGESTDPGHPKPAGKVTPNESKNEPENRKATAVKTPIPIRKALPYSPGVKRFRASPSPMPSRKTIPLQRFNQEGNPNG
jgi:hypothetical protein